MYNDKTFTCFFQIQQTMRTSVKHILLLSITAWLFSPGALAQQTEVNTVQDLEKQLSMDKPGMTILINDGDYTDIKLLIKASGTPEAPIIIKAKHPGKASFSGNVKVALYGDYIELNGIYFREGISTLSFLYGSTKYADKTCADNLLQFC